MGWFSKKQPKPTDDALVEQTLAFVQEVSREEPQDDQSLQRLIDHIQMMPKAPAPVAPPEDDLDETVMPPVMQAADAVIAAAAPIETPVAPVSETPSAAPAPSQPRPVVTADPRDESPSSAPPKSQPPQARPSMPQSELRREIAQRVQNFRAHQQRLNDEREARIRQVYATMQARSQRGDGPASSAP